MPDNAMNAAFAAVLKTGDGLINHNIRIGKRRTSFRLDRLTWRLLYEIARHEAVTVGERCTAIKGSLHDLYKIVR